MVRNDLQNYECLFDVVLWDAGSGVSFRIKGGETAGSVSLRFRDDSKQLAVVGFETKKQKGDLVKYEKDSVKYESTIQLLDIPSGQKREQLALKLLAGVSGGRSPFLH